MHRVKPKVFLIGETLVSSSGLRKYFDHLGIDWKKMDLDTKYYNGELLTEFMGRLCYRSFEVGMNANVTKIREDSGEYIRNILKSGHGSVLEHSTSNWVFADVSRVFTHELVRHRVGTAFSQESLRFVRLTDLGLWLPADIQQDPKLVEMFEKTFKDLEELQLALADYLGLDDPEKKFHDKKVLTSAMRRVAPIGLATTIGCSMNYRTLRHLIAMRTAEGAEAEIRQVFTEVAIVCRDRWPLIFQDMACTVNGAWVFANPKI